MQGYAHVKKAMKHNTKFKVLAALAVRRISAAEGDESNAGRSAGSRGSLAIEVRRIGDSLPHSEFPHDNTTHAGAQEILWNLELFHTDVFVQGRRHTTIQLLHLKS